jgi:hypothetical protein
MGARKKRSDPTWTPSAAKAWRNKNRKKRPVSANHPFKLWAEATAKAKKQHKVKGFGLKKGTDAYKTARKIYDGLKKKAAKK